MAALAGIEHHSLSMVPGMRVLLGLGGYDMAQSGLLVSGFGKAQSFYTRYCVRLQSM